MVSVQGSKQQDLDALLRDTKQGLTTEVCDQIDAALVLAQQIYGDACLPTGEQILLHGLAMAAIASELKLDGQARIGAILFAVFQTAKDGASIEAQFGGDACRLAHQLSRLSNLKPLQHLRRPGAREAGKAPELRGQLEILRKMLLAMADDIRVVILRLASRLQSLRFMAGHRDKINIEMARESLEIYAPLANRLGLWQLKWEIEDLSFRFLEPKTYSDIARLLDEKRTEREKFIAEVAQTLHDELSQIGITTEVYGRPKHIYSIYNKMRLKSLSFNQLYDVRAIRVLVDSIKQCYAVLGVVHELWVPIADEFDDYILKPKGNNYQSLHTAVITDKNRSLEVQIRTREMHRHAELGVASHWRYKEGTQEDSDAYDGKIALLRNLLSWKDELTETTVLAESYRNAKLDDTIYVFTPQGQIIDLERGATAIDFAYRLHTDLGSRCRGAKVDGQLVPLDRPLDNAQQVEIITTKSGGPSRDWLKGQSFVKTTRARQKIRQYFNALDEADQIQKGRQWIVKELQRESHKESMPAHEELAMRLGFGETNRFYQAAAKGELSSRTLRLAIRGEPELAPKTDTATGNIEVLVRERTNSSGSVLIVGVGELMNSLARCCKPSPPDAIQGFITRGRGVSVHRLSCRTMRRLAEAHEERIIPCEWGVHNAGNSKYEVDIVIVASGDNKSLLKSISDVLAHEKIEIAAIHAPGRGGHCRLKLALLISNIEQLYRALGLIQALAGVVRANRADY